MWSDYVFCTVADVRARLLSPEVILAVSAAPDTAIGITVSGSTLIAGVPLKFTSWTPIQFSSTGTLPAPLVTGTTYYAILTNSTTFQVASILGGLPITLTSSGSGQISIQNVALNAAIEQKIVIGKRWIYNALQLEIQNRVPMIAKRWMNRKRGQVDYFAQEMHREFEILAKTAQIPIVPGVYDGSVIDLYMLLSMTQGLVPRTFSFPGPPVNGVQGSYAGQAYPGAVYIDTLLDRMYYQTGTLECPIWTRPNAQFVLDNLLNASAGRIQSFTIASAGTGYLLGDSGTIGTGKAKYVVTAVSGTTVTGIRIANPGTGYTLSTQSTTADTGSGTGLQLTITGFYDNVLLDVGIDYTLWAMAQDGMFRNRAAYDNPNIWAFGTDTESMWSKRAKQRLSTIVPLLELDIDGDGVISDFEAQLTHAPRGVFA